MGSAPRTKEAELCALGRQHEREDVLAAVKALGDKAEENKLHWWSHKSADANRLAEACLHKQVAFREVLALIESGSHQPPDAPGKHMGKT